MLGWPGSVDGRWGVLMANGEEGGEGEVDGTLRWLW